MRRSACRGKKVGARTEKTRVVDVGKKGKVKRCVSLTQLRGAKKRGKGGKEVGGKKRSILKFRRGKG